METRVPPSLISVLKRQKYHFVGRHSAVKRCKWLHDTLIHDRSCYKQKFYGIKTHQCIQMTPAIFYCTQQCLFCWRVQSQEFKTPWGELNQPNWDPPEEISEGCISAQHAILSGYKDNPNTNMQKLKEAQNPKHVAISLSGEPTLYGHIDQLISAFHNRGFTTFLVSNGTTPSVLMNLSEEPTQLYISVCAPDKKTFRKVCRPQVPRAWDRLNETLRNLPNFKCPTVVRITSVRGLNMNDPEGYARLIRKCEPTYIETKAYVHVGFSRERLTYENTPSHDDIRRFSRQLEDLTGYNFIDEAEESRVVLLSRLQKTRKFGNG